MHAEELIVMLEHSKHIDYALTALQSAFGQRACQLETKGSFQEALGSARKLTLYTAYLTNNIDLLCFSASYSDKAMRNSSPLQVDLTSPYESNIRAIRILKRGEDPHEVLQRSIEASIMARRPEVGPTMVAASGLNPE